MNTEINYWCSKIKLFVDIALKFIIIFWKLEHILLKYYLGVLQKNKCTMTLNWKINHMSFEIIFIHSMQHQKIDGVYFYVKLNWIRSVWTFLLASLLNSRLCYDSNYFIIIKGFPIAVICFRNVRLSIFGLKINVISV